MKIPFNQKIRDYEVDYDEEQFTELNYQNYEESFVSAYEDEPGILAKHYDGDSDKFREWMSEDEQVESIKNDMEALKNFVETEVKKERGIITLDDLKNMKPGIIATGYGLIEHPRFNHAKKVVDKNNQTLVKWVAVRGGIHDWAIYHSLDANLCVADYFDSFDHLDATFESIAKVGAKLRYEDKIRMFVPCDDEAFAMYNFNRCFIIKYKNGHKTSMTS